MVSFLKDMQVNQILTNVFKEIAWLTTLRKEKVWQTTRRKVQIVNILKLVREIIHKKVKCLFLRKKLYKNLLKIKMYILKKIVKKNKQGKNWLIIKVIIV